MKIVSVVGTRPQFIKAAALQPALRKRHEEVFVDTGQHYDDAMAGAFFGELGLARPDHSLGIGGGSAMEQIGRMLVALEPVISAERPDAILVYGDTNSTLAGSLAGAKLAIPVAHVEAGLRSFDRGMPEEQNRIVADHLSTWLLAPTPTAVANLAAEGIRTGVVLVGDLLQDLAARTLPLIRSEDFLSNVTRELKIDFTSGRYLLATIHRAENRAAVAVARWTELLRRIATPQRPVVLALHPGTRAVLERHAALLGDDVRIISPQGYRTSLALQLHAAAVLTDSGGVQREAFWLGVPCLVLRAGTEWVEAVASSGGAMSVVGLDPDRAAADLARIAPAGSSEAMARARARAVRFESAGAADAIVQALDGTAQAGTPGTA